MVSLNGQFRSMANWRDGTAGIVQNIACLHMNGWSWLYWPAGHQGIDGGASPMPEDRQIFQFV